MSARRSLTTACTQPPTLTPAPTPVPINADFNLDPSPRVSLLLVLP